MASRVIVIGDIHGCLGEFQDLVDKLAVSSTDRVVCLGDFMDKGPKPGACVRFARENGFESVLGNHEEWHVRWRKRQAEKRAQGIPNPMKVRNTRDILDNDGLSLEDVAWMSSLPVTLDLGFGFFAVHGGVQPGVPMSKQDPKIVIRARWFDENNEHVAVDYDSKDPLRGKKAFHWSERWGGPESIIYGHEAFSLSDVRVNDYGSYGCYGIDTGVVHGGHLTAMLLPSKEFVQVKARRVYLPL